MTRPLSGTDATPFADLPAALVEEVLGQTAGVAERLLRSFSQIRDDRESLRKQLVASGLVISESSLGYPPLPTTCAADGSYAIERLLTTDLAAAARIEYVAVHAIDGADELEMGGRRPQPACIEQAVPRLRWCRQLVHSCQYFRSIGSYRVITTGL